MDLIDCALIVQLYTLACPLYVLQTGSWIQRLDQTTFGPFGKTIEGGVLGAVINS